MANDWAAVLPFVSGAVVAIGGGMAAAWLQGRSQERIERQRLRREEAVERQHRRERAAEVLGEVSALLRDTDMELTNAEKFPEASTQRPEIIHAGIGELSAREKAISEQLLLMAIREPSAEVRRLAQDLDSALSATVSATYMAFASRKTSQGPAAFDQLASQAKVGYDWARDVLKKLVEAL
jgi:hypothetical protein